MTNEGRREATASELEYADEELDAARELVARIRELVEVS